MLALSFSGRPTGEDSRVLGVADLSATSFRRPRKLGSDVIEPRLRDAQKRINRLDGLAQLCFRERVLRRPDRVERFPEVNDQKIGCRSDETRETTPTDRSGRTLRAFLPRSRRRAKQSCGASGYPRQTGRVRFSLIESKYLVQRVPTLERLGWMRNRHRHGYNLRP